MGFKKKQFGQHFLADKAIISSIIEAARLEPSDNVVEIGPGAGALTPHIAECVRSLVAIEIDKTLIPGLEKGVSSFSNVKIVNGDALKFDFSSLENPVKVVSNLPYNISTPITFKLLHQEARISDMVLMYQKEVGERLTATPGGKSYGSLSVITQFYRDATLLFHVDRRSFSPPPGVDSCVVRLAQRKQRPVFVKDEAFFFSVVKASFSHRRKTLKNSLSSASSLRPFLKRAFARSGVEPGCRAETLTLSDFASLANVLKEESSSG
ncbi:MAG: 16S rRNA (adenine(1518)-N(6)/adenine(1519)-N(6))-dimethyltransferase RsmA [Nitrospinota bacterium]